MPKSGSVLVTGAARGLGRAIAASLAKRDWNVWATDISEIVEVDHPAQHRAVMDVRDPTAVAAVLDQLKKNGPLRAIVNNAGIMQLRPWDELDLETWQRTLDVNLTGTFVCSQAAAKIMRDQGQGGAIVNIASVTFFEGHPVGLHYTASKGGVIALTRSLARVLGPFGIRVNTVAPSIMKTEGVLEVLSSGVMRGDRIAGEHDPMRVLPGQTEPSGVADVTAFLLSEDAREITGQLVLANGGTFFY